MPVTASEALGNSVRLHSTNAAPSTMELNTAVRSRLGTMPTTEVVKSQHFDSLLNICYATNYIH